MASQQCVVGVYDTFDTAREAIQALEASGFPADKVSFVTHSVGDEVPDKTPLQYGDNTEKNAGVGAGMGGLLGLLLGTPMLAVPGLGPLLIAGPIAAGLTGAAVGGLIGAMSGWGIHEDHVRQYDEKVRAGALLVIAEGSPDEVAQAERVLRDTSAESVIVHAENSADSPEIERT